MRNGQHNFFQIAAALLITSRLTLTASIACVYTLPSYGELGITFTRLAVFFVRTAAQLP